LLPEIYLIVLRDGIKSSVWIKEIGKWSEPDYRGDVYYRLNEEIVVGTSRR